MATTKTKTKKHFRVVIRELYSWVNLNVWCKEFVLLGEYEQKKQVEKAERIISEMKEADIPDDATKEEKSECEYFLNDAEKFLAEHKKAE